MSHNGNQWTKWKPLTITCRTGNAFEKQQLQSQQLTKVNGNGRFFHLEFTKSKFKSTNQSYERLESRNSILQMCACHRDCRSLKYKTRLVHLDRSSHRIVQSNQLISDSLSLDLRHFEIKIVGKTIKSFAVRLADSFCRLSVRGEKPQLT